jgi:hypothetical protein
MPLLSAAPVAIAGALAIFIPSIRTYGALPTVRSKREAAEADDVASSALNVPGSPAPDASLAHCVSAPAIPEVVSKMFDVTNANRPVAGITMSGLTFDVSKQNRRCSALLHTIPLIASVHRNGPPDEKPRSPWFELVESVQSRQVKPGMTAPLLAVAVQTLANPTLAPVSSIKGGFRILPLVISETRSANGSPSGLTNPRADPSRVPALTVEVESHALKLPGKPAPSASDWQSASAPASPPRLPSNSVELTNTTLNPGVGVDVGVAVLVAVGVGVAVADAVCVAVAVAVDAEVELLVAVAVGVDAEVGVLVDVAVGVDADVEVLVDVAV